MKGVKASAAAAASAVGMAVSAAASASASDPAVLRGRRLSDSTSASDVLAPSLVAAAGLLAVCAGVFCRMRYIKNREARKNRKLGLGTGSYSSTASGSNQYCSTDGSVFGSDYHSEYHSDSDSDYSDSDSDSDSNTTRSGSGSGGAPQSADGSGSASGAARALIARDLLIDGDETDGWSSALKAVVSPSSRSPPALVNEEESKDASPAATSVVASKPSVGDTVSVGTVIRRSPDGEDVEAAAPGDAVVVIDPAGGHAPRAFGPLASRPGPPPRGFAPVQPRRMQARAVSASTAGLGPDERQPPIDITAGAGGFKRSSAAMSAPKPSTVAAAATTSYARAHAPSMHDVLDMPVSAALEAPSKTYASSKAKQPTAVGVNVPPAPPLPEAAMRELVKANAVMMAYELLGEVPASESSGSAATAPPKRVKKTKKKGKRAKSTGPVPPQRVRAAMKALGIEKAVSPRKAKAKKGKKGKKAALAPRPASASGAYGAMQHLYGVSDATTRGRSVSRARSRSRSATPGTGVRGRRSRSRTMSRSRSRSRGRGSPRKALVDSDRAMEVSDKFRNLLALSGQHL